MPIDAHHVERTKLEKRIAKAGRRLQRERARTLPRAEVLVTETNRIVRLAARLNIINGHGGA